MHGNKKIIIAAFICAFMITEYVQAKARSVTTRRDFERNLSRDAMVVALFYEDQKGGGMRDKNKGLIGMYEDVSKYQPYDDADIIFLKVNVSRKELADLASLYGVTTIPMFLFFSKGQRLIDAQGNPIMAEGFISRMDLQALIDRYYGMQIKNYVAQKEKKRNQIIEQENESWKPYFYPRDMVVRGYAPEERQENME